MTGVIDHAHRVAPTLSNRELADKLIEEPLAMFARLEYVHEASRRLRDCPDRKDQP